ncbi:energy transducer TonB [Mucilaginibacter koreensis]
MLNTKFDLYKTEWLDLVFTNRNKSYGAYELRKHSGDYAMRALVITASLFIAGGIAVKLYVKPPEQPIWSKPTIVNITPPQPAVKQPEKKQDNTIHDNIKTKPAKLKPVVHTSTEVLQIPKVVNEEVKEDRFTPQTEITNPGLTTENVEVTNTKGMDDSHGTPPGGTPGGTETAAPDNSEHIGVDVMPEPVGGMAAWSKFLQRNIRYPDTEAQGKVYLSFVVERDGKISNISLTKGVDRLLDEEALRVLKIAPAWKPGLQAGQPVRVRYNLPINFQLEQ